MPRKCSTNICVKVVTVTVPVIAATINAITPEVVHADTNPIRCTPHPNYILATEDCNRVCTLCGGTKLSN